MPGKGMLSGIFNCYFIAYNMFFRRLPLLKFHTSFFSGFEISHLVFRQVLTSARLSEQ